MITPIVGMTKDFSSNDVEARVPGRAEMAKQRRNRHRPPGGEVLLGDFAATAERRGFFFFFENTVTLAGDLAPIRYVTLRGNARSRVCLLFLSLSLCLSASVRRARRERALRAVSVNCYVQTSQPILEQTSRAEGPAFLATSTAAAYPFDAFRGNNASLEPLRRYLHPVASRGGYTETRAHAKIDGTHGDLHAF